MNNKLIVSCILVFQILILQAYQPYQTLVTVGSQSARVSDPNLVDLSRSLRSENIQALIPIYTPTSAVSIDINLRGIQTITGFAANSTTLVVAIPQLNETKTFSAATRDESLVLFRDYIRNGGNVHGLLRAYAKYSPIDPGAGNPNSTLALMGQADYRLGTLSPLQGCSCSWEAQPIVHQFQVGVEAGRAFAQQFDTTLVTLPLRYSYSPDLRWAFIMDVPLNYIRNGGASSAAGSLGIGLRTPLMHNWSLTPAVRLGVGGSLDLCTSGNFFSTGVTSVYNLKVWDYVASMTNFGGYYTSTNLWLTGVNFNYQLHNGFFKNGLALTSCNGMTFYGKRLNFSVNFVDSVFTGDSLYMNHFDELGISLITTHLNPRLCYDCFTLGFTYKFGAHYRGYYFNAIYQF